MRFNENQEKVENTLSYADHGGKRIINKLNELIKQQKEKIYGEKNQQNAATLTELFGIEKKIGRLTDLERKIVGGKTTQTENPDCFDQMIQTDFKIDDIKTDPSPDARLSFRKSVRNEVNESKRVVKREGDQSVKSFGLNDGKRSVKLGERIDTGSSESKDKKKYEEGDKGEVVDKGAQMVKVEEKI